MIVKMFSRSKGRSPQGDGGAIKLMFEDKTSMDKYSARGHSQEVINAAKDLYDLLLKKSQQELDLQLHVGLNFKVDEKEIKKDREKFQELQQVIQICKGDSSEEMKEFESLMFSYQMWQSTSRIQSRPQKSDGEPVQRRNVIRRNCSKRLSMTVRASRQSQDLLVPDKDFRREWSRLSKETGENIKLKKENEMLRTQVDELTTRLSKIVSDKLTDGNPNFTDLSDRNRPTKIGEKFGLVYDEEWSEAFEEIKKLQKKTDEDAYKVLLNIVMAGVGFCQEVAKLQISSIERGMSEPMLRPQWLRDGKEYSVEELEADVRFTTTLKKFAKDFRRGASTSSISPLCTIFKDAKLKEILDWDVYKMESLNLYIDACIECLWLMCVQDPPMDITWLTKGAKYDPVHFNMFMTKGKDVEYTVWPALFLYKDGPLVTKGYVKLK